MSRGHLRNTFITIDLASRLEPCAREHPRGNMHEPPPHVPPPPHFTRASPRRCESAGYRFALTDPYCTFDGSFWVPPVDQLPSSSAQLAAAEGMGAQLAAAELGAHTPVV